MHTTHREKEREIPAMRVMPLTTDLYPYTCVESSVLPLLFSWLWDVCVCVMVWCVYVNGRWPQMIRGPHKNSRNLPKLALERERERKGDRERGSLCSEGGRCTEQRERGFELHVGLFYLLITVFSEQFWSGEQAWLWPAGRRMCV